MNDHSLRSCRSGLEVPRFENSRNVEVSPPAYAGSNFKDRFALFLPRQSFLQELRGVFFGLFWFLTCGFGCFLERFIGDVLRVAHVIIGHLASAVVTHKLLPFL